MCDENLAGWLVRHVGYRWTFISGLVVYGIGSLMFWPSAKYESFGGFCGSLFIVGSGLSTLETSANPYIATCGPPRLSEMRLQLAQAFQAIGTVVAPLLAARVFFTNVKVDASDPGKTDNSGLENVQVRVRLSLEMNEGLLLSKDCADTGCTMTVDVSWDRSIRLFAGCSILLQSDPGSDRCRHEVASRAVF